MSVNVLIKVALAVLALGAALLLVTHLGQVDAPPPPPAVERSPSEVAQGIEGDRPEDVVHTLVQQVRVRDDELDSLRSETKRLSAQQVDADALERALSARFDRAIEQAEARWQAQRARAPAPPPVIVPPPMAPPDDAITWLHPVTSSANEAARLLGATNRQDREPTATAVLTLPKNATLTGATAFTALIGRVPIAGNVVDPYLFKVRLGADNLAANGFELPELAEAVVAGRAVGDWALGCVAGDVHSITFIFADGTIVTQPEAADLATGATSRAIKIGELADARGNPCVPGERVGNAATYLGQRIGLAAVAAAARATAASETTTATPLGLSATRTVTGEVGDFIAGETLAGAASATEQWLAERASDAFDAVYVAPGQQVAIHLTEAIAVDRHVNARRVRYAATEPGTDRSVEPWEDRTRALD